MALEFREGHIMRDTSFRRRNKRGPESGQAMIFTVLGLAIFLIGAMAFAIDFSNIWFNRQAAQTAADAACTAGAMDLLVDATNSVTTQGGFTAGTSFGCNSADSNPKPASSPCKYAALNGFNSSVNLSAANSGTIGNNVSVTFPASVAGVTTPPSAIAPTAFMQVTVTNNMPSFFAGMLKGLSRESISAFAICGVSQSAAPIPILVLDPQTPAKPAKGSQPAALDLQGTPTIQIFGGPNRSIQVNSAAIASPCKSNNCSVNNPWGTSATIDLSAAGPGGNGADMAISGSPAQSPSGFNGGTAGHWIAPAAPISDPFAQVCYPGGDTTYCTGTINGNSRPTVPSSTTTPAAVTATNGLTSTTCTHLQVVGGSCMVRYQENGCPDQTSKCVLYEPGAYPTGISVSNNVAIFDPGLYYIAGGLAVGQNSIIRPGTGAGDGSGGVTFYFSGSGTVSLDSNSGKAPGSDVVDSFNTMKGPSLAGTRYAGATTSSPYYYGVACINAGAGATVVPPNISNGGAGIDIPGNILLGPCTGYYGDPLGTAAPSSIGEQRWFLFFQDRSATGVLPQLQGGAAFLTAGTMYFHSCGSTTGDSGSGLKCTPPPSSPQNTDYFQDILSLQGNTGSSTYVLGEIVTDNLGLGGGGTIVMDLNPSTAFNILKASLYQ
jgi:hypothetical protein